MLLADAPQLEQGLAENIEATVLNIARDYSHILAPATAYGKNIAPRIAAKLDVAQISDITAVDSADTFERPIYAGNAIATVQPADPIKVWGVRGLIPESRHISKPNTSASEIFDLLVNADAGASDWRVSTGIKRI
ncbi:Electron transfer flavoprotein, alpha subunit (fragment) [Paraburkholderia ribeironis]|uniref:Electron transfer flavoprotein, alpha subunit n=1 Tax=Paraburkholderia ribeironis TaxID=1247936 RepID=A0A1N7SPY8_9BURK